MILLVAAGVRLWDCDGSPGGLQVDEASNAWNAWCLHDRATDEHGEFLPVFYTGAFGDNRSPLFLYLLLPFQAIGGMGVCTTRLPAASFGVVAVALIYLVGRRLFDRPVALVAAALLAVDPWHVQHNRWGHEANITPFLSLAVVALVLKAGLPIAGNPAEQGPARTKRRGIVWPATAGLGAGVACYGYAAIRIYLPVLLLAIVLVTWRAWRARWRDVVGRRTVIAAAAGFVACFAPLAYKHLTDPAINVRGRQTWVWSGSDSPVERVGKALARYPGHFGPRFLFVEGSTDPAQSPPRGFGATHWYVLPLLLAGVVALSAAARRNPAARVALAALLAYPAGDLLSANVGPNALRSFPGAWALVLVAAVGAVAAWRWLRARGRRLAVGAAVALGAVVVVSNVLYLRSLFGQRFNRDTAKFYARNVDLLEALDFIRPELDRIDAVLITQADRSFLYAPTLVYLNWRPGRWFDGVRVRSRSAGDKYGGADLVWRFDKFAFLFTGEQTGPMLAELRAAHAGHGGGRPFRTVLILSPTEEPDGPARLVKTIRDPAGHEALKIFEATAP